MKYREIKPTGFSCNFIQCYWEYENSNPEIEHTILPDGFFDLIATFDHENLDRVILTGVWTKPVIIKNSGATHIFAIRFKLLASEYLFQQELKSIMNTSLTLPLEFWNIHKYQRSDFEVFVSDISNRLNNSIRQLKEIDSRKLKLFDYIYKDKLNSVKELSQNVIWSSRQINRYFGNQFGFPLKEFLKIVRFRSSYEHISNGELYPQMDFFDQAHFIKDVKKYSGTTPKELFRNKNDRFLQLSGTKPE